MCACVCVLCVCVCYVCMLCVRVHTRTYVCSCVSLSSFDGVSCAHVFVHVGAYVCRVCVCVELSIVGHFLSHDSNIFHEF